MSYPKRSQWEIDELNERKRHVLWLVEHGASIVSVSEETGIPSDKIRDWVRYSSGTA